MDVNYDVLILLVYPVLAAVFGFGLYWVIRLAVRAGIRDADERRRREEHADA